MAKYKNGNIVQLLEDVPDSNISKGEIGIVTDYVKDYDQVTLRVLNDEGDFDATIVLDAKVVKKIGNRIKLKKIEKLWEDDIVLVDGDASNIPFAMKITVARKIKKIDYDPASNEDTLTISGDDFTIVVKEEEFGNKVPVVV